GEERLQDVPVPISVIDASNLAETGQVLMRDYFSSAPGMSVTPGRINQQQITIRGITTLAPHPTVGVTIDDAPYGGATNWTSGGYLPDFDPGDLARIEVLRGPQGTLYGENSMGGLVRFVTIVPSPTQFSGRIEVGTDGV